jgi:hypothetical protein
MRVLFWMLFQASLTGFCLFRETLVAHDSGRTPEPLPVFVLSTLGALALAALINGCIDYLRSRQRNSSRRTVVIADGTSERKRGAGQTRASNDNPDRARPAG